MIVVPDTQARYEFDTFPSSASTRKRPGMNSRSNAWPGTVVSPGTLGIWDHKEL